MDSQELMLTTKDGNVTGIRYYAAQKATIAAGSDGSLSYLFGDHQGTDEIAVDAFSMNYTRRAHGPFGTARGPRPEAGAWPGEKGFVGGTNDAATGLTHLGAREYDADKGRFTSVDGVMDPTDPQQMNAYAYANNTPVTASDPSGDFWFNPVAFFNVVKEMVRTVTRVIQKVRAAQAATSYYKASRAMWAKGENGTAFGKFNVGKGKDRGIIMARFFIHTEKAMKVPALGYQLLGDNRTFSDDPSLESYRMVLFWDTATGDVTFKVSPSHTVPGGKRTIPSYLTGGAPMEAEVGSMMKPANDLTLNDYSANTMSGNNIVNYNWNSVGEQRHSTSDKLDLGVHGVQSLFPLFAVDADLTIAANESSVTVNRRGDSYPDMEVVQYRRNQGPSLIAQDSMGNVDGLDSIPKYRPKINRQWTNGAGMCLPN
ncbi:RHS repeat-associated core domain-containing protein [Streptomyces sp. NBC_00503]|uniref:RHS repeat-associated core domain-containing protein n=1 Tax=Streptomyces sp. NBC_00503 TaxID=2903659 RepID=UPI002E81BD0D|nr:RHS repeat-associated core domain-containing protein [Streptomyces sp. NBC_00503]WUD79144.1 RHS repeat-associated core domain-containing protein [Streptomyces sp. NBC_00503]